MLKHFAHQLDKAVCYDANIGLVYEGHTVRESKRLGNSSIRSSSLILFSTG